MWRHDTAHKSAGFVANRQMDLSAIYSKTPKGLRARASLIGGLSSHLMKVLTHVDGNSRAEVILLKFDNLTPQQLSADLAKLVQEGYIRVATVTSATDDSWALTINFEPMQVEEYQSEEELEAAAHAKKVQQAQQFAQLEAEQQAKQEEEKRLAAAEKAEKKAQKIRDKEKIKAEVKVKAQLETERKQQAAAEAVETARIKAQAKIEHEAKLKAQQAAEKLELQQAAELAAKLAEETRLKAELKAREAAEQAEAAAEATAKEHANREIERISRESDEAQKKQILEAKALESKALEFKVRQEAERMEALRLAEVEATEKAHKDKLLQQQLAAEALESARLETERQEAEKVAQDAALKQQLAQEKLAQEKLRTAAIENEKLAKQKAHLDIANVLRKAEEDRKKAAAQIKAEKLEAKRLAKVEQELAKEFAKEQAKQQKLKADADAKTEAAENARREQEKMAKQVEVVQIQAEQAVKQQTVILDLGAEAESEHKQDQTAQIVQAKLVAEEQANLDAKENARLEMQRIGHEAELARQKASAEASFDENINHNKNNVPNKDLPNLDDFSAEEAAEEAAFEAEEQLAEAEHRIQSTIEKTAKKAAETLGRADIRHAAIAEAEAMASVHGKTLSFVSAKNIKQWLGSVSKVTFVYLPMLVLILLALLHFINLSALIKPIEQLASDSIGEPVEIKKVHASLWPQPHLVLENIAIGTINIKVIHVLPESASLFEDTKHVKSLVIEGLNIEHASFGKPINWASNISKAKNLKVDQINLKDLTLAVRDLQLESFDGQVKLTDTGALSAVDLVSSNNALSVMILPQGGDNAIVLKAANWALPLNPKIIFSTLKAKGLVNQNKITFSQIDAEIYGGSMTGQVKVQWPDGAGEWQSTGDFVLTDADAEQLLSTFGSAVAVDGKLILKGNFSSTARKASELAAASAVSANFDVRQGSIKGIELARAVISRGSQSLAGDSTNFDKLSGSIKTNQNQYQFGKLVLASPQFNASGFININANQVLTGRVNADLAAQSRRLQASFTITGRGKDLKSN